MVDSVTWLNPHDVAAAERRERSEARADVCSLASYCNALLNHSTGVFSFEYFSSELQLDGSFKVHG